MWPAQDRVPAFVKDTVPLEENMAVAEKWQSLTWAACISGGHLTLRNPGSNSDFPSHRVLSWAWPVFIGYQEGL